jgi:hypothetical protein
METKGRSARWVPSKPRANWLWIKANRRQGPTSGTGLNGGCQLVPHKGTDTGTSLDLGARCLGHFCFPFSRQLEEHAQPVIETFLVVPFFPFLEGALPRFALSAKRQCHVLVQPAARLRSPLYPHRRNVSAASLEKPIAFQHAPVRTLKQCCLPWHDITSVSCSLQINIQANRESLLRTKMVPGTVSPFKIRGNLFLS